MILFSPLLSRSVLDLARGAKGTVVNGESLCGNANGSTVRLVGQDGAIVSTGTGLQVDCGAKKARTKRRHRGDVAVERQRWNEQ